jgi:hypothetical protein
MWLNSIRKNLQMFLIKKSIYGIIIVFVVLLVGCNEETNQINDNLESLDKQQLGTEIDLKKEISSLNSQLNAINTKLSELSGQSDMIESQNIEIAELESRITDVNKELEITKKMLWGSSVFDRKEIAVGSEINNMTVTKIAKQKGTQIYFEGETKLKGVFSIHIDNFLFGDYVAFELDRSSTDLPRAFGDTRYQWFVFSNHDEALNLLKEFGETGEVSIVIDEFTIDLAETATYNRARLLSVDDTP